MRHMVAQSVRRMLGHTVRAHRRIIEADLGASHPTGQRHCSFAGVVSKTLSKAQGLFRLLPRRACHTPQTVDGVGCCVHKVAHASTTRHTAEF